MQIELIYIDKPTNLYRQRFKEYFNAMRFRVSSLHVFLFILACLSVLYWLGVPGVPFHPDESSYLFMSSDVDRFTHQPSELFWLPGNDSDLRQHYRLINPPLIHVLDTLGRWTVGLPALTTDWNWGKTWVENQQAGALPSPELLLAARMTSAALYPFSVLLVFLAARRATNEFTAWTAALLLAGNALVLLHTRRAMSEGGLLFATAWLMWSITRAEKRAWLTAIPAALAFCAKMTLAALAPVGVLAIFWQPGIFSAKTWKGPLWRGLLHTLLYGGLLIAIIFLFYPVLWQRPIPAIQAAVRTRQELAAAQVSDRNGQALATPGMKIIGMIGGLYLTPPIFSEVSNYTAETRAAEAAYLANPLNSLFRSLPGGGLLFLLTLFGCVTACLQARKAAPLQQRRMGLLLVATLVQTLALLVLIPLAWQRYYLPLEPFTCLWEAYGLYQLSLPLVHAVQQNRAPAQPIEMD